MDEAPEDAGGGAGAAGESADAWMMLLNYPGEETLMEPDPTAFLKCDATLGLQSTLTRSQFQVLEFLNGASTTSSPSTVISCPPPPETAPLKLSSSPPVMHPNLVSTLKTILSTSTSSSNPAAPSDRGDGDSQGSTSDGDSTESKASAPESAPPWLRHRHSAQAEAVMVSLDLIHNRRPYQCAFHGCQRTFKNPQTMRMHYKTHFHDSKSAAAKLEPPPACADAMVFTGSPVKAGHNKKIPTRCPKCWKTFVGLYELRRHFGRKHSEGEKGHACRKCAKRFYVEVDVRDHEKLCGEPIVCSGCGMKFAFKCNLVAHKRSRHPGREAVDAVDAVDAVETKREGGALQFENRYTTN